jgi:hypothetical protein
MRNGKYTVDSIEKGMAKLLFRKDELVEELLPVENFSFGVKEGDLVLIGKENDQLSTKYLEKETTSVKDQVRALREELLDRGE